MENRNKINISYEKDIFIEFTKSSIFKLLLFIIGAKLTIMGVIFYA